MDLDLLKTLNDQEINDLGRIELGEEKCKAIDKYKLRLNRNMYWEKFQNKYPVQEYFSHKFAMKSSVLGMVFHIFRLCYAKTKYFESNLDKYEPLIFDWRKGFIVTELYDMEFIRNKYTGIIIDLRNLEKINQIKVFKRICKYIEDRADLDDIFFNDLRDMVSSTIIDEDDCKEEV